MNGPPPTAVARVQEVLGVARASLRTERKHLQRLVSRLQADAGRADEAPRLREQGEVLKVQLQAVPRGADRVVLPVPWEPERTVEIALQREQSPAQNLERLFRRARGLDQGRRIIAERRQAALDRGAQVAELEAGIDALLRVAAEQDANPAMTPAAGRARSRELQEAAKALRGRVAALRLKVATGTQPAPAERKIARKAGGLPEGVQLFASPEGRPVLAGRSAAGNDALVTRLLRGRDAWFHVRDQTGAHVALRVEGKAAPAESELRACAVLAAHLSGVAKGDRVEVSCVEGRHVRKAKGAPPGTVYLSHERVLRVTVDAAVVDGFYARRPPAR